MCIMCEGGSLDDVLFDIHGAVERCGFFIQVVETDPVERGWAYTIGLSDGFAHPEFVVVGRTPQEARWILDVVGRDVVDATDSYRAGETMSLPHSRVGELVEVHEEHFDRGLLANWSNYYSALDRPAPRRALQIVELDPRYCRCHQPPDQIRLDDPSVRF